VSDKFCHDKFVSIFFGVGGDIDIETADETRRGMTKRFLSSRHFWIQRFLFILLNAVLRMSFHHRFFLFFPFFAPLKKIK
jgi:hypothetical protein